MKLIYIVGSGHCGSTLLDMILGAHSKVFGAGEIQNLKFENKCACLKYISDCEKWKSLKGKINPENLTIFRDKINFLKNSDNFYFLKNKKNILDNIIKNNPEIEFIVDSSKDIDRLEFLLKYSNLDIYVIHLVRDGRAVSWSYIRKYKKVFPWIFKWFLSNLKIEIFKKRHSKKKLIFIKYENFIEDPEKEIKKILRLINLDYKKSMLKFRNRNQHQVGGNRMRLGSSNTIKKDMEWKGKMPSKYKVLFNLLFGIFNIGYKVKE
jgi:hypothetical protein